MNWLETALPGLTAAPSVHPMLVHFPIALWSLAIPMQVLGCLTRRDQVLLIARWLLYLGTLAGLATLISGYLAANQLGHDSPGHDFVHVHRNFMVATTIAAGVLCVAAFLTRRKTASLAPLALAAAMVGLGILLTLGADRGAALVFRYGVGVNQEVTEQGDSHPSSSHAH